MQAESQRLRHRADQIDLIISYESENGTRSKNEDQRDDWRGDNDRAADVARRCACFPGQDAHIFEPAQRADRHLGEDIETIEDRHRGSGDLERAIYAKITASEHDER